MDLMDYVLNSDFQFVLASNEDHSQQNVLTESSSSQPNKRPKKSASSEVILKPVQKDQKMHRSIFEEGGIANGIPVFYMSKGEKTLKGYKLGHGIFCTCCNTLISASQFEVHAGRGGRRRPYDNIFVNGISLHAYVTHLKQTGEHMALVNDDVCGVCEEGEKDKDLVLCSGCPRHFHIACISETKAPLEKWFCEHCQGSKRPISDSVAGGNSIIEEVTNSCIPIIDNHKKRNVVACSLCRSYDFSILSVDGFNDKTVIVCDQCEFEFHIGCLRAHCKGDLKTLPPGSWFCSFECGILNYAVKVLVAWGPQKVPDSLMDNNTTNCDAEWIIVHGNKVVKENKPSLLLDEASKILIAGFNPIKDTTTQKDMIKAMTYGGKIHGSDFAGMHCAILKIGSNVVTAGLFRVFGHETAELPIVATGQQYQQKGYLKVFFRCFERLLSHLKVKKLVVPAAEETIAMWTKKFGLRRVTQLEQNKYKQKHTAMVAFTGTSLLEKEVPEGQNTFENRPFFNLNE